MLAPPGLRGVVGPAEIRDQAAPGLVADEVTQDIAVWSTLAGRADTGREVADTGYVLADVLQGRDAAARPPPGWDVGLREPDKHLAGRRP